MQNTNGKVPARSVRIPLRGKTLVFVHLQRCGGSTLNNLLDLHFHNREILRAHLLHRESDQVKGIAGHTGAPLVLGRDVSGYRLITGHNNLTDVQALAANPVFITFLRHPVDRVVSLYDYWRSHTAEYAEKHGLQGPLLARRLSLAEFVESEEPEARYNVGNGMARQLLGGLVAPIDLPDSELLLLAGDKLERFSFVGITEMFDLSAALLCYVLQWNLPDEIEDANRFEQNIRESHEFEPVAKEPPSGATLARLIEKNRVDLELYRRGRALLQVTSLAALRELMASPGPRKGEGPVLPKKIARRLRRHLTDYLHPQ